MTPTAQAAQPTLHSGPTGSDHIRPGWRMVELIRRRPLLSFFLLACLLSWWPAVLYAVDASPLPIASFGPFLAALIVLALTGGDPQSGGCFAPWSPGVSRGGPTCSRSGCPWPSAVAQS
jgi:hypothetical protein